jgi:hypothetical protein
VLPALLALATAAGGPTMRVDPPFLVLGKGGEATIEISGADTTARVGLTVNVGVVTGLQSLGGGHWKASYRPPTERRPQVAIFLADLALGEHHDRLWASLPLHGNAPLPITTKPDAKVEVTIGGQTFGPVAADKQGRVVLNVVVPPGVRTASVRATDKLGNVNVKEVDLAPPRFARLRAAPPTRDAVSWADPEGLELELFAIEPDGSAATKPPNLQAARGWVSAPVSRGQGIFDFTFRAPEQVGSGAVEIKIAPTDEPTLGVSVALKVKPGPPARVELKLSPPERTAGAPGSVKVEVAVLDGKGNPAPSQGLTVAADFGAIEKGQWKVPDGFGGRDRAVVRAHLGGAEGEAVLALKPGPPAGGEGRARKPQVRPGESTTVDVQLRDAFGNPAAGASLAAAASAGRVSQVSDAGSGKYTVDFLVGAADPPGPASIVFTAPSGPLPVSVPVEILPQLAPWGIALGFALAGQSNFSRAHALGPQLELALRLGGTPIEILGEGMLAFYRQASLPYDAAGGGARLVADVSGIALRGGLRASFALTSRLDLHLAATAGTQRTESTLSVQGAPAPPATVEGSWSPHATGAAGIGYGVGPGRVSLDARYVYSPAKGQLSGSLGGASLALGYRVYLR